MKNKEKKSKNKNEKKSKSFKIGIFEFRFSQADFISMIIVMLLILIYIISPRYYSVTTGLYNQGTEEDQKNVLNALGVENTENRFKIYFQWYNVIHELGHGLIYYNNGVDISVADEEQLVNDFAVAYWKYYGEEDKLNELKDIVNYAVEHIGTNYADGVDYLKLAKENSNRNSFNSSFFNFNDYGWFQFSCVKHSFETDKDLETVLKEMGFDNFKLTAPKKLVYKNLNEEVSTTIINDAVNNFNEWGLKFPKVIHHFNKDPNNNYSRSVVKYLWLFEVIDIVYNFS